MKMDRKIEPFDDGEVIIRVLASVLTRLVDVNQKSQTGQGHLVTKFQSSYVPGISILAYLERIRKYSRCSDSCFIVALIYIDRVIEIRNVVLTSLNVHRILLTSVLIAAKFFDDEFFNNAFYSKLGGVPAWEMNTLELEFLHLVNFSLYISNDVFMKYQSELRNYISVIDIARPPLSPPFNSDPSSSYQLHSQISPHIRPSQEQQEQFPTFSSQSHVHKILVGSTSAMVDPALLDYQPRKPENSQGFTASLFHTSNHNKNVHDSTQINNIQQQPKHLTTSSTPSTSTSCNFYNNAGESNGILYQPLMTKNSNDGMKSRYVNVDVEQAYFQQQPISAPHVMHGISVDNNIKHNNNIDYDSETTNGDINSSTIGCWVYPQYPQNPHDTTHMSMGIGRCVPDVATAAMAPVSGTSTYISPSTIIHHPDLSQQPIVYYSSYHPSSNQSSRFLTDSSLYPGESTESMTKTIPSTPTYQKLLTSNHTKNISNICSTNTRYESNYYLQTSVGNQTERPIGTTARDTAGSYRNSAVLANEFVTYPSQGVLNSNSFFCDPWVKCPDYHFPIPVHTSGQI